MNNIETENTWTHELVTEFIDICMTVKAKGEGNRATK
jgi:hypothetical protein